MLSRSDQYRVLRYLGWPISVLDETSTNYSNILRKRLERFPDDASDILSELLDRIEALDADIQAQNKRSNIRSIDDIQFFEGGPQMLRKERRQLVLEVASLMDFPVGQGAAGGAMGSVSC